MATIGVKIELEGAPQYVENMRNLTAQTKLYQAQMKRLTQELSGASAFTKSIAASKALSQQLEAQKNQAKLLSDQIAKNTEKYGEDSTQVIKLKTQYENLQAEIARTTQALKDQGGVAGAVAAEFEEVGNKISSVGDKVSSVGNELSTKISAPIVAMGAASLKAFDEVDGAMDTLIKKTGATGTALEGMNDVVNNIATSIPTSFDVAANAVGEVNTRFGLTGDALEELSSSFVKFAELNNTDVSSSIDTVQKALSAYGLSAEEAIPLLDRLNKVGQDTGISVEKVAEGLVTNATAFQEMGLSIDEAATFMGQLEKSGANVESVMGGLSKALKNATEEGKPLDQALADLQGTIENGTGSMDGLSAAYDLFGKSAPQVYQAIQEGVLNFEDLAGSMESASGSVADTFEATLDPVDELQQHMNELKLVGTDIANQMMPTIKKVMDELGNTIKKVSEAWNGLSEDQQDAILKALEIVAVVGPILSVVGKIVGSIGTLVSGVGKIIAIGPQIAGVLAPIGTLITGTIIPAIGGVIAAIVPFLPVIAGVAAAIAAVVVVVRNWGTITDWISEKWAAFTEYISEAVTTIHEFFSTHMGVLGEMITARIEIIKTIVSSAIEVIKTVILAFGEAIKAATEGDWSKIGEIIKTAWIKINAIILSAKAKVIQTIVNLLGSIKDKFIEIKDSALSWGSDMIQNFIDGILAKWEALKQTVKRVADSIKEFLGFSLPEKGPLHTSNLWPKHFMQQYADGIESMRYLVQNAVADVSADVAVLQNPMDADEIYSAIRSGASDATLKLAIGDREFGRALRNMGVVFNG